MTKRIRCQCCAGTEGLVQRNFKAFLSEDYSTSAGFLCGFYHFCRLLAQQNHCVPSDKGEIFLP